MQQNHQKDQNNLNPAQQNQKQSHQAITERARTFYSKHANFESNKCTCGKRTELERFATVQFTLHMLLLLRELSNVEEPEIAHLSLNDCPKLPRVRKYKECSCKELAEDYKLRYIYVLHELEPKAIYTNLGRPNFQRLFKLYQRYLQPKQEYQCDQCDTYRLEIEVKEDGTKYYWGTCIHCGWQVLWEISKQEQGEQAAEGEQLQSE